MDFSGQGFGNTETLVVPGVGLSASFPLLVPLLLLLLFEPEVRDALRGNLIGSLVRCDAVFSRGELGGAPFVLLLSRGYSCCPGVRENFGGVHGGGLFVRCDNVFAGWLVYQHGVVVGSF